MPTKATQDLSAFITELRDGELFARAGRSFALLTPGDWRGLQRWAESFGYAFTLRELHAHLSDNPSVLAQMGKSPQLSGWSLESLQRAAES